MDRFKISMLEKHLIRFKEGNQIKYYQDFQCWQGIPSGIDFKVETLSDGNFVLTAYGYGQLEPYDKHSYGNGNIFPYYLTEEQKEFFKKHSVYNFKGPF
jgi:hypothetical protein